MRVFIVGVTGGVGSRLASRLLDRGDFVDGLVRRDDQQQALRADGVTAYIGDLTAISVDDLAGCFTGADAIVYAAGSNGGSPAATKALDGAGVEKSIEAAQIAGTERFALVSVLPESWRERDLGEEVEYYFTVKKAAETTLTRSVLNWLILRPSLLVDDRGAGTVSLGPAEFHGQISRDDVAATLAALSGGVYAGEIASRMP